MIADPLTDRLARVRDRFATTLAGKIDESYAAIPQLSCAAPSAAVAVADVYRCVHGLVGVGPTVGFPATGKAARDVENVLRAAQQECRGLTADEIAVLTKTLQVLRQVAARELRPLHAVGL